jgi:hypothetical protein
MERRAAIEAAVAELPLMLTVEQTRNLLGIGRSLAYAEVRRYLATGGREGIPAVRIGGAIRIPRARLVDLLLAEPAPTNSEPVELHVVPPAPMPGRTDKRVRRPVRSKPACGEAQLPFAEPTG